MSGDDVRARFPHTSIRASAGSGKTYQLTNRYLGLVQAGADVGSILATTFTRVAAGEIRDRIVLRLAEAAEDDAKREKLAAAIDVATLTRKEVLDLLRVITSGVHRLQIRTLDSFFGAIVRSFAIELGVAAGSRVLDEVASDDARHEAVRRMLDEGAADELVELLRLLTQGTSERSVMSVIDGTVAGLYDLYREAAPDAWAPLAAIPELSPAGLESAIGALGACPLPPKKSFADARKADVERVRSRDWAGLLKTGLASKVARGEATYRQVAIEPALANAYVPIVEHAKAVLVNRMRDQTLATRRLLESFDTHYRAVKRRRHAITFSDVTAAVADAQRIGAFDDICFRIDATVQHLLLDEFQDTNVQQWRAIEPIALEIVGDESRPRTFFCVGDVKQSIYGWRDACPEVLDRIPELLPTADGTSAIQEGTLEVSYRSAQAIIDVVNRVFEPLRTNVALADLDEAAIRFERGFKYHGTALDELDGYAELRVAPRADADAGEKQETVRLRAAAELVRKLHDRAPGQSIAVLTRTNRAVSRLLYEFGPTRLNLPASGRGGGPLTDSAAVGAVLDMLTLADHPDDTVAAFNVARGPLGEVVGLADEQAAASRRAAARSVRRRLLADGYAATIAAWTRRLASSCDERQHRRLLQLVELAGEHDATAATTRPQDFVRVVEHRAVAQAKPAPIEVMTVHQSKGREFDIVVLPELESPLAGVGTPPVVFERRNDTEEITRILRWVTKDVRELLPEINPLFVHHRTRAARESLCLLYVAMTRARQGLYLLIDPPRILTSGLPSDSIPKTAAGLLRGALTEELPPEPGEILYTHGDALALFEEGQPTDDEKPPTPTRPTGPVTLAATPRALPRGLVAKPASARGHEERTLADDLDLRGEESKERGAAMHRLFEQITWIDEWSADEDELLRLVRHTAPRRPESWARDIVQRFLEALRNPGVRAALERATVETGGTADVWRERRFARMIDGEQPTLQQGRLDRLVIERDAGGRPRRARVIDFKTDDVTAEAAPDRARRYLGQIDDYRSAAARMLDLDESRVRADVLFVLPGRVVTLYGGDASPGDRPLAAGERSQPG